MTAMLKPTDLGGWGRGAGPDGGLTGREFSSRCPPTVKPRTRIVAVCGVDDSGGASSPAEDGWFHSDFYLFHHLFSGLGSNQVWLTCVDPAYLVSKYKEFIHGNRQEMRRIVLDAEMLPDIQRAGNVRVVESNDLLERFLATLRSECKLATSNEESVLVLIFGHGHSDTYGVAIGGKPNSTWLTTQHLSVAIGHITNVTLLMTSCYSGGWVIKTKPDGSRALLNATVMAAAGHDKLSESWAKSESSGRAAGSIYASAILKAAIQMQSIDKIDEEDENEVKSSLAYVGWAKFLYDIGRTEVDHLFWKHEIKFAAQNDSWDSEWKTVSGLPTVDYKAKWETLKTIPMDTSNPITNRAPNANSEVDIAALNIGEPGSVPLGQKFQGSFLNIVREQARQYLNSFPGNDAAGCNSVHNRFRNLVKGQSMHLVDAEYLEHLSKTLCYRVAVMELATDLKNYFGLQIADGHLFDTVVWEHRILEGCNAAYAKDPTDMAKAKEPWTRYSEISSTIMRGHVFPSPTIDYAYSKPWEYLAIAFYESGRSKAQILEDIKKAANLTHVMADFVKKKILMDPVVERHNNRFFRTCKKFGKRVRSLSPSKDKKKGQ